MPAIPAGVREAKAKLSKVLRQVCRGAQVLITDRGHPVERIVPVADEDLPLEVRLRNLEDSGILEPGPPGRGQRKRFSPPLQLPKGPSAQKLLRRDGDRS